jgi:hypothetical protein
MKLGKHSDAKNVDLGLVYSANRMIKVGKKSQRSDSMIRASAQNESIFLETFKEECFHYDSNGSSTLRSVVNKILEEVEAEINSQLIVKLEWKDGCTILHGDISHFVYAFGFKEKAYRVLFNSSKVIECFPDIVIPEKGKGVTKPDYAKMVFKILIERYRKASEKDIPHLVKKIDEVYLPFNKEKCTNCTNCCCKECATNKGYLHVSGDEFIKLSKMYGFEPNKENSYGGIESRGIGFLGPDGCKIPRELRSHTCLNYCCDKEVQEKALQYVHVLTNIREGRVPCSIG